ncbi:hypothetical protein HK096_003697 [Nowakowskiella sp. JEL0078]|nr:hypothetical protein HK096_003697 [Nowakowskiella sp. JEL0078]
MSSKQRKYRKREVDDPNDDENRAGVESEAIPNGNEENPSLVVDLLSLRKLRMKPKGLAVDELNKGDLNLLKEKKKEKERLEKLKDGAFVGQKGETGLSSFASQSTSMNTEKLMQDYIEQEMKKRKGENTKEAIVDKEEKSSGYIDIHEELFAIPEHLQTITKKVTEGNVTLSASMLTAIPEVDLGVEYALRNYLILNIV